MSLTSLLFLSIPAALVAFKLALLVLATVWAVRGTVAPWGSLSSALSQPLPVRSRSRSTRA